MESGKIKADYTGIHISNKNRVTKRGKNDKNEERRTLKRTRFRTGEGAFGAL